MPQRPNNFTLNMQHPLANGLVFAGLGAHAGSTRYHDSSAYGNTGTLTNMDPATDWVLDRTLNRLCQKFDGSTEYISTGFNMSLLGAGYAGPFTILMWVYPTALTGYVPIFDTTGRRLTLFIGTGYYGFGSVQDNWYTLTPFVTNQWQLAGMCRTASGAGTGSVLKNGSVISSLLLTTGTFDDSAVLELGRNASGDGTVFTGYRSDCMIYSRMLSTSEHSALADPSNVMLSGLILPPRRKWWPVVAGGTPATSSRRRRLICSGY